MYRPMCEREREERLPGGDKCACLSACVKAVCVCVQVSLPVWGGGCDDWVGGCAHVYVRVRGWYGCVGVGMGLSVCVGDGMRLCV